MSVDLSVLAKENVDTLRAEVERLSTLLQQKENDSKLAAGCK